MNIFHYESKFTQTLMFVADLVLLNLVFVLCSLPVVTIGAAQAALYSGIRTLQDPEDDEHPVKAFFKAFKVGFRHITLGWGILALAEIAMAVILLLVVAYGQTIAGAPVWACLIVLALLALVQSQVPLFHARFSCTAMQLIRNSGLLIMAHPLRSVLVTVLLWAPAVLFGWDIMGFVMLTPAWALMYYSVAYLLAFNVMKKPFKTLIDHYNETHGIAAPEAAQPEEEA